MITADIHHTGRSSNHMLKRTFITPDIHHTRHLSHHTLITLCVKKDIDHTGHSSHWTFITPCVKEGKDFTDVSLACEDGLQVEAHKVVLIASSPFFLNILRFIITFIITFMRLPSSRRELLSELTKTEKSHKQERMN